MNSKKERKKLENGEERKKLGQNLSLMKFDEFVFQSSLERNAEISRIDIEEKKRKKRKKCIKRSVELFFIPFYASPSMRRKTRGKHVEPFVKNFVSDRAACL